MNVGEPLQESDAIFCTWHGIQETSMYFDSQAKIYGLVQHGIVVAISEDVSLIAKMYVLLAWK